MLGERDAGDRRKGGVKRSGGVPITGLWIASEAGRGNANASLKLRRPFDTMVTALRRSSEQARHRQVKDGADYATHPTTSGHLIGTTSGMAPSKLVNFPSARG